MPLKSLWLSRFLTWSCKMAGKPISFILALAIVFIWLIAGFIWGFSSSWLLLMDTIATINASLMVFVIQNTQNRDARAIHLKLDEMIHAIGKARNEMIQIEYLSNENLQKITKNFERIRAACIEGSSKDANN